MIEFAILAPVLILLVIGVIEIGRYMYFGIVAAHMAESGARYGAQSLGTAADVAGMRTAAIADGSGLGWSVLPAKSCSQAGSVVGCPAATPRAWYNLLREGRRDGELSSAFLELPGNPEPHPG